MCSPIACTKSLVVAAARKERMTDLASIDGRELAEIASVIAGKGEMTEGDPSETLSQFREYFAGSYEARLASSLLGSDLRRLRSVIC
jgi:hypothetical protein